MIASKLLQTYLAPLEKYLKRKDIIDICIQEPGIVRMQTLTGEPPWLTVKDANISFEKLLNLGEHLASYRGQEFSDEHPILGTTLPDGKRIYCVRGPSVETGLALSIRVAQARLYPLENYFNEEDIKLILEALEKGKSIVVVGGTGSGKTTLMNSIIQHIPPTHRIIAIEDSGEIYVDMSEIGKNFVRILVPKDDTGEGRLTYKKAIDSSLRMNPDKILVGELDYRNTKAFLRICNTGHSGSMTTLHADSPELAYDAMAMNGADRETSYSDVLLQARKAIDYIAMIKRDGDTFTAKLHPMKSNENTH